MAITAIGILRNNQRQAYPQAMLTADSIASEHPDSAAALLKDLDGKQ